MNRKIRSLSLILLFFSCNLYAAQRYDLKSVRQLSATIFDKEQAELFTFKLKPSVCNFFEIRTTGKSVTIRGNSPVSIAAGLNYYLTSKVHAPIGWSNLKCPATYPLLIPKTIIRKESPYAAVLFLGDDSFDALTKNWDWERWKKELDFMALHGVTHPVSTLLVEQLPEVLAQKITKRMREYGMKPTEQLSAAESLNSIHLKPEYIQHNPIQFDLQSQMVWQNEAPDTHEWVKGYPLYRYGYSTPSLQAAWEGFYQAAYQADRPYDHPLFAASCETFFQSADILCNNPNYQVDAVRSALTYLSNLQIFAHNNLEQAYNYGDRQISNRETKYLLQLDADVQTLLRGEKPVETAQILFQKYRAKELAPAVAIVELPITFKDGYGPFQPQYHTIQTFSSTTDLRAKTYFSASDIPTEWKEVKRGVVKIDPYTHIALATTKNSAGKTVMVIDANHNHTFKDDPIITLKELDPSQSPDEHNYIPLIYERTVWGRTIRDTVPLYIGKIPGQEVVIATIPRHATTHLGEVEITVCSRGFGDFSFQRTELRTTSNSLHVSHGEFFTYQDTLYLNKGVDLNKNALILEKTTASQNQLYAPQIGFNAIPFKDNSYLTKDSISIDDYRGKHLILCFWGTWSIPCIDELPYLCTLYNNRDTSKLEMIGIPDNSPAVSLDRMIQRFQINWPQIISNEKNTIVQKYNISSFPTFILIAPNGKILGKTSTVRELEKMLGEVY